MQWLLKILNKRLAEERKWLQTENLAAMDPKYREGARMAKERIPQLEKAIEVLKELNSKPQDVKTKRIKKKVFNQISLWDILNKES